MMRLRHAVYAYDAAAARRIRRAAEFTLGRQARASRRRGRVNAEAFTMIVPRRVAAAR